MENLQHPPIDFVQKPLFQRVFQTVFEILKNSPYGFFKKYTMKSTPWSAYLFATTYCGLLTVLFHGYLLFFREEKFELTKFLLILMLDYFSILVLLPLFLILTVQLIRLLNFTVKNTAPVKKEDEFKVILNILFFSTSYYFLLAVDNFGKFIFLFVFFVSVYMGMVAKGYEKYKSIIVNIAVLLIYFSIVYII
jgi:hypothetical protein